MNFYRFSTWEKYTPLMWYDEDMAGSTPQKNTYVYDVFIANNVPPPDSYRIIRVKPGYEDKIKTIDNGDFVYRDLKIVSQRVVDAMGDMLSRSGALYPLEVHGFQGEYWLFHVTNIVDCLDEDRCSGMRNTFSPGGGRYSALDTFAIDGSRVHDHDDIFRVPHYSYVFVSENFCTAVKKHKLTGVKLLPEGVHCLAGKKWVILNKSLARSKKTGGPEPLAGS